MSVDYIAKMKFQNMIKADTRRVHLEKIKEIIEQNKNIHIEMCRESSVKNDEYIQNAKELSICLEYAEKILQKELVSLAKRCL